MSENNPIESRFHALMCRLDELLAEAKRIRAEVTQALQRGSDRPFWPDRRHGNVPHQPDRRRN